MGNSVWFPLVVTSVIVIVGWFIAHWLTSLRDAKNKRRETQVTALRSLYMKLAMASNRDLAPELERDIESFVAEIQLYGNQRLTELTAELVQKYKAGVWVSYDALLRELRDQLREELNLPPVNSDVWWIRFGKKTGKCEEPPKD